MLPYSAANREKVQPLVLGGGTIVPPVQTRAGTLHYKATTLNAALHP